MAKQKEEKLVIKDADLLKAVRAAIPENGEFKEINWACYDKDLADALMILLSVQHKLLSFPKKKTEKGKEVWIVRMPMKIFTAHYSNREVDIVIGQKNNYIAKYDFAINHTTGDKLIYRFKGAKQIVLEFKAWFDLNKNKKWFASAFPYDNFKRIEQLEQLLNISPDSGEFSREPQVLIEELKETFKSWKKSLNTISLFDVFTSVSPEQKEEKTAVNEAYNLLQQNPDDKEFDPLDSLPLRQQYHTSPVSKSGSKSTITHSNSSKHTPISVKSLVEGNWNFLPGSPKILQYCDNDNYC